MSLRCKTREYQAVVFDMDGVIFDSERAIQECWDMIGEKYDIPDARETCLMTLGVNMTEVVRIFKARYGQKFPFEKYSEEVNRLYWEKFDDGRLPMKPGVVELLEYLKQSGKKIALASSTYREKVMREIQAAGLQLYFDELICGDMVERSKPDPDIYLKACAALSVNPSEAYAIEDSYNGIRSASRAGLHPIMVPDIKGPTEEMKTLTEVILPSLHDVLEYLK